jgi:hypothetical protein
MSNSLYKEGKNAFLNGLIDMQNDTIKIALYSNAYSPNAADTYATNFPTPVGTPQTLGSKTVTGNVFDAADPTFTAVASGTQVNGYIIYADNGVTPYLIGWVDTGTGLPFTTNGGNITITFSSGSSKIFAL